MHWWDLNPKSVLQFPSKIKRIDMHWWDLITKSFRRFSCSISNYRYALVGP